MADSDSTLCECGCGQLAPLAKMTSKRDGTVRGRPVRFIRGHNSKADNIRHGHASNYQRTPTYSSWTAMRVRCTDPRSVNYDRYGGRGITVCDRWLNSFENFLADMGERPVGTTLDRYPDKDGNYEPGNCRWATKDQQNNNTSQVRQITAFGRTQTITEWAREFGLNRVCLRERLNRGWKPERALTEKVHG